MHAPQLVGYKLLFLGYKSSALMISGSNEENVQERRSRQPSFLRGPLGENNLIKQNMLDDCDSVKERSTYATLKGVEFAESKRRGVARAFYTNLGVTECHDLKSLATLLTLHPF
jgi:hypothetical protein